MTEFGEVFDFQLSATCFECLTLSFMLAYSVGIVWILNCLGDREFDRVEMR